jgi:hypothetical protein
MFACYFLPPDGGRKRPVPVIMALDNISLYFHIILDIGGKIKTKFMAGHY